MPPYLIVGIQLVNPRVPHQTPAAPPADTGPPDVKIRTLSALDFSFRLPGDRQVFPGAQRQVRLNRVDDFIGDANPGAITD